MNEKKIDLVLLAKEIMAKSGFDPEFSDEVIHEVNQIQQPAKKTSQCQDLRSLLWCSIDNDDSRDLDQLTYAEKANNGDLTIWVAVADVDALVRQNTAIDSHAQINTTSIYTPAKIFPMLPEKLSTDLTSLSENENRIALIIKIILNQEGETKNYEIFEAQVYNWAKLAYPSLGAWLEGKGPIPEKVSSVNGLEKALVLQNEIAQILKKRRHALGALTLHSSKVETKCLEDRAICLEFPDQNLAQELIEHFMIAANSVMAMAFKQAKLPSFRRVVRIPLRWDKIVDVAKKLGSKLPNSPNSLALDQFLVQRKEADPESFPDLSLTIIKLLGRGEYVVEVPGDAPIGHFGLALSEYTHSTAPNRRFPDLISQRQYKAYLQNLPFPYSLSDLQLLADHCTQQEDAANKVERHLNKSAAAMHLSSRIGESFQGIVTGASEKGTWIRIFDPPVEGKIIQGHQKLDVGDRVSVKLVSVDIYMGFIDFIKN